MEDTNYLIATQIMHWILGQVEPNNPDSSKCWYEDDGTYACDYEDWIPNEDIYCTFEAEEMFPKELLEEYVIRVIEVLGDATVFDIMHASPSIRCEAMLYVLNNQKEENEIVLPEEDENACGDENY